MYEFQVVTSASKSGEQRISLDVFGRTPLAEIEADLSSKLAGNPTVKISLVDPSAKVVLEGGESRVEEVSTVAGAIGKKIELMVGRERIPVSQEEGAALGRSATRTLALGYVYLAGGIAVVAAGVAWIGGKFWRKDVDVSKTS